MVKKTKVSKVDVIKNATDAYNQAAHDYKVAVKEYEAMKIRLTGLRLARDTARYAIQGLHAQRGVTVHSEEG